jgi:two-component system, OmpR family, sensor kinase
MDGGEITVMPSLQRTLSIWLSLTIICLAVIAGFISYFSAFNEAHEFQDDVLKTVATSFEHHLIGGGASDPSRVLGGEEKLNDFVIEALSTPAIGAGQISAPRLKLPASIPDGLQTLKIDDASWRVLVRTAVSGNRFAVAQRTDLRDDVARSSGLTSIIPLLFLIPLLLVILTFIIRMMFKPVNRLAQEMSGRTHTDLEPMRDTGVPRELRPFVKSTNVLLGKVSDAMRQQRRFVSDAAHELRSPLTALSLHVQNMDASAINAAAPKAELLVIKNAVERLNDLVEQLLSLARSQSLALDRGAIFLISDVLYRVLEDFAALAEEKNIDLGLSSPEALYMRGDEFDVFTAVRNLVDNAIRYADRDGRVDIAVRAENGRVIIEVSDDGPGIAPEHWDRVCDPFYRILGTDQPGSGLGLAIVKALVEKMGGTISLDVADKAARKGLKVILTFAQAQPLGGPD